MNANNSTILVFDLDRTLFNTDALYQDLYALCEDRGVQQDVLNYSLGLIPPSNLLFNFFVMVERSQAAPRPKLEKLISDLRKYIRDEGRKYVFDDVMPFFKAVMDGSNKARILTYGDIDFQTEKFVGCKLSKTCNDFTVTQDFKYNKSEIFKSSPTVFFDDNPRDIDGVKKFFPHVKAVEVKRPGTKYYKKYSTKADIVVEHLSWPLKLKSSG